MCMNHRTTSFNFGSVGYVNPSKAYTGSKFTDEA